VRGRRRSSSVTVAAGCILAASVAHAADAVQQARDLARRMQYDAARGRLEMMMPDLEGDARSAAFLLLATLVTEPKDVRRCLSEATLAAISPAAQRAAMLEQAKLEYAHGSYRTAQSRLANEPTDPEVARWLELCAAGLGEAAPVREATPPAAAAGSWTIQLGAFGDRGNALRFRAGLPRDLQPVSIQETEGERGVLYRVICGAFPNREAADAFAARQVAPRSLIWSVVRTSAEP
jgi:cell division septation protein DedD